MARITSVRLEDELSDKLDALAESLDRSRSWVIEQAVKSYLDEQSWQIEAVREALTDYRSGRADIVSHERVMSELEARIAAHPETGSTQESI